jgi:hypothetical protein
MIKAGKVIGLGIIYILSMHYIETITPTSCLFDGTSRGSNKVYCTVILPCKIATVR